MLTIREELLNAKVHEPFGTVRLAARAHEHYHGPIYQFKRGSLWIWYNDRPLEVIYLPNCQEKYVEMV